MITKQEIFIGYCNTLLSDLTAMSLDRQHADDPEGADKLIASFLAVSGAANRLINMRGTIDDIVILMKLGASMDLDLSIIVRNVQRVGGSEELWKIGK
jgi:hypothetical protein